MTGPYINVTTGLDRALTGDAGTQRPVQVLASPYAPNRTFDRYLNPAAFAQPALGTYGNMGNYSILAPGAITVDMSLSRTFRIRERSSVQLRVEAFNLPNHVNPGTPTGVSGSGGVFAPSVSLNSPNFGRILSARDPRIMQGALKFQF
jgi:hypothetical protein